MDIWKQIEQLLNQQILSNRVENILWCICIIIFGLLLKNAISRFLSKLLYRLVQKESQNLPLADFMQLLRRPVEIFITLIIVYTAFSYLRFPPEWKLTPSHRFGLKLILLKSYQVLMIISITWIFMRFITFFAIVFTKRAELTPSPLDDQLVPFFKELAKVFLVVISIFITLGTVFSLDVGSIVAGLGIGGLAVALAAKESLENLFASFTIFLDKPFVAGDVVQVGEILGKVEKVGFRSTRIRTLDKSFLTLPNKMMIDQPLDNLTQRRFRRSKQFVCLTYDTPIAVIQTICEEIKQAIANNELTKSEPAQVRFTDFGESSLNILLIYFVEAVEWSEFNRIREQINYKILEIVAEHKASFAFPTRTIRLENEESTFFFKEK